ncbi:hypothetical protein FPV67DRAFT_1404995 [Lyophyllum atratum]|nr:hypothetical protein FPV67DRAFT_1404995 [Lyophyllum atratum]
MFSVKATYRGEIRRFSFPDSTSFPSFDQLDNQLHRVFPSRNTYYLSKLLFCPDSSKPGRILIAREVHNADDYNKCLVPFQGRSWPNALLRFSLLDEDSNGIGSGAFLGQTVGQVPWGTGSSSNDSSSQPQTTPRPISSFYIPPPPVTFAVPPRAFSQAPMDIDPVLVDVSNQSSHRSHSEPRSVPPPPTYNLSGCCSVAQTKAEIQDLLQTFQQDLDRILSRTFEYSPPNQNMDHMNATMNATRNTSPTAPVNNPFLPSDFHCSSCGKPAVGQWFTCSACSALPYGTPLCQAAPSLLGLLPGRHGHLDLCHPFLQFLLSTPVPFPPTPPPPAIHRGVICDACDLTIVGIRHKCLDCPDYDLCTACMLSGSSEHHNPRHQFFELAEPTRIVVHTVNVDDEHASLDPAPFAPAPAASDLSILHHATCDLCDSIIQGSRYKCTICPDFDTCSSCFTCDTCYLILPSVNLTCVLSITDEQHPDHSFVKLSKTEDYIVSYSFTTSYSTYSPKSVVCTKSIEGVRYKCMHPTCPDFDLCEKCEALPIPQHPDNHPLLKMKSVETVIPTVYRVGQTSTHAVPESVRTPAYEHGYMHNPSFSWGTVASEPPSPILPTARFDPVVGPFSVSPSSPVTSRIPDFDGAIPAPLLNGGSWYGGGLNSLMGPTVGQLDTDDPRREHEAAEPSSPHQAIAAESPLNNEALLSRPPISEMQQITPPNSRSLAELLNDYRSMSSLRSEGHEALNRSLTPDIMEDTLSAGFIEDVTAPDGQMFAAGVTFIKVWRMVNNGTRDWPASTEVVFAGGAQLTSGNPPPHIQPMRTVGPLKPGEEKNVWTCELKAPDAPGKYTSYWRLQDDKGQLFGDSIWVEIEVVNPSYSHIDESLTSSSIIVMPDPTLPRESPTSPSSERVVSRSPTILTEEASDDGVSDSDSVSLISMPSSEDEEDAVLWADSRARATADYVAEHTQAMEYVLLYDDNTSEEE